MTLNNLLSLLSQQRREKQIVFTNGCFDLLHIGHIRLLTEAKSKGDILVVAVNSDVSVRKLKGPDRPLQTAEDRCEILQSLKAVDYAFVFDNETPEEEIRQIRPDVLVKGGDWPIEKIVGAPYVQSYGGQVLSLPFVAGRSTTKLVEKILKI